jgi:repressor of nif and glnA expression
MITESTRQLSFEDIKPQIATKYNQILEILSNRKMTAREIETEMNRRGYSKYFDMNHVRPRLTELVDLRKIMECETREDSLTHKHVTVYTRRLEK